MKTKDKLFAIDSNVIIRYLIAEPGEHFTKAENILDSVADGALMVSCDPVVLAEVVWVLESFYKRERAEIASALEPFLQADSFLMPEKPRYLRALRLYGSDIPHFGDACVCAAALEDCNGELLSFDRYLSVEGIKRSESADQSSGE